MPDGKAKPDAEETPRDDRGEIPPWVANLPPEIRDAFVGGDAESIPAEYREVIRRYNLWLQKQQEKERKDR
jgi:hypothetical protein